MSESKLMKLIQMQASNIGARLFRNNVGTGWVGRATSYTSNKMVKVGSGDVLIRNARPLRSGLCKGSSDLIGWYPRIITADMVGSQIAIFTAVEVKYGQGKPTPDQVNFIDMVKKMGGNGGIVYSIDEAMGVMK